MKMKLIRPICFFDIESTGLDVARDRIISIAIKKQLPDGFCAGEQFKFNPGIPINPEASAKNGFTDESVKGFPSFKSKSKEIHLHFLGCDLCGYNLINFDVPILWEEFFRCGITWDLSEVNIIDAGNIFKKKEERTLSAAVKFYCLKEMQNAHDALADVTATAEVLDGQLERYPDLDFMSVVELAAFSKMDKRIDLAGKFVTNKKGEAVYSFGKSKGLTVVQDPGFAHWMLTKDFTENTKAVARQLLKR
jgi:DNA polymerase-3 subunit epsilon